MPVMELTGIWKIYKMGDIEVNALKNVSFKVDKGERVIIIGPSGSGKSTLLQILGCLDRASKGQVNIDDVETEKLKDRDLSRVRNEKIGFVFQKFNLLPKLTALGNVELPMIYAGKSRRERIERSKELLELVGLGDRMNHKPTELSGGQQQRVAIARSLANNPAFILADEPTGNLDTKSGEEILSLFMKLNYMGKTLIMVTHDMEMIKYGSRVIKIRDGEIEANEVINNGNPS